MNVTTTEIPGVLLIEPRVFRDPRGYFLETWNLPRYSGHGLPERFVQDNLSVSAVGVLRGLHVQTPNCQAKLVSVVSGSVYDVAVDVRRGSPTFGRWVGQYLTAADHRQLFIPAGFAHGFVVTGEASPGAGATFVYKCDAPYAPGDELTVRFDDPDLGIEWPTPSPVLSDKDRAGLRLGDVPADRLPPYKG